MRIHCLKIEQHYLEDLLSGEKTFELRINDRNYQKGDVLKFCDKSKEIGDSNLWVEFKVLSVLSGNPLLGLKDGWVILSIKKIGK